jgi:signal transduction histidine kinase
MSHELRSPLNGILGASELLGEGLFGPLTPKQHEYIRDINQSGHHLLRLIDDVLDLSRIEAGQMQFDPQRLNVAPLMESCVSLVRGSASAKSQELVLLPPDVPLIIMADERAVTQVACNLLSNALKFTPERGRILFTARRDADRAIFVVDDQGPGIAPEFHQRIFEQFFQVSGDRDGTGLGLPLARQLIEAQGGSISLESELGSGSRFSFSLPLSTD